ncbi:MAG: hypothetical protein K0S49_2011 [Microbacterium sp.]|nr:hypothetical protein [Microbacterium sp.]
MVEYVKRFLSLEQQVQHLRDQGLDCGNQEGALRALHEFGYYRLTAYTYPFRRLLPEGAARESSAQYRSSEYLPGSTLADGVSAARFDSRLRETVFAGVGRFELALRFQLAHTLGRRGAFAHLDIAHLDQRVATAPPPGDGASHFSDAHSLWLAAYREQARRAQSEDFVTHIFEKYDSRDLPLWVAVEILDFGALTRLYKLLKDGDQSAIARRFGVTNGKLFSKWLVGVNLVRNHCAHHGRLWNRKLSSTLKRIAPGSLTYPERLEHLANARSRTKVYPWLAVLAYCLTSYDPASRWHHSLAKCLATFPQSAFLEQARDMGSTPNWSNETLWTRTPQPDAPLPTPIDLSPVS